MAGRRIQDRFCRRRRRQPSSNRMRRGAISHPRKPSRRLRSGRRFWSRMGWRFIRIRGSAFFRDPEAAMKKVPRTVNGIRRYAGRTKRNMTDQLPGVRLGGWALKQRAAQIRADWKSAIMPFRQYNRCRPATGAAQHRSGSQGQYIFSGSGLKLLVVRPFF